MTNLFSYPSKVFAHRGCGTLWPENTLQAIALGSSKYGFKACEFDVMLSKDNIPFLMHDDVLERTINSDSPYKGVSLLEVGLIKIQQNQIV